MQVPGYDTPQVQEAALPGVRQSSVVSPELLSAGADRQIQQGNRMTEAGSELNRVAIKMQHEQDLRTVQGAVAQYTESAQNFSLDAQQNRTGAGASGLVTDFDKFHGDTASRLAEGLQNEHQKQAFQAQVARSRLSFRQQLGHFEIGQSQKATDDNFNAVVKNQIDAGAGATTPEGSQAFLDPLIKNVRAYAATKGMLPDQEKQLVSAVTTDFHTQRIQQLVSNPDTAAQAEEYYKAHEEEIAGSKRAEVGGFAKKATANANGSTAAAATWGEMGPKNDKDPVNLFDMEERIRKDLKGNEPAIEAGIKGLHERYSSYKTQLGEQSNKLQASATQLALDGASASQLRGSPEFISLSEKNPKAATELIEHVERSANNKASLQYTQESRAEQRENRAERKLHRDTFDVALAIQNPTVLVGMSRDQVTSLLPKIGEQSTREAVAKWEALHKDKGALAEAKIDDQQFKAFAQRAGLDITPKANDDVGKERLINLRDDVERIIGQEQQRSKKLLTREEKDVILKRVIDDKVIQHNFWSRDAAVSAFALPPGEEKSAYVMVGEQKVKLSQIPETERTAIIAARKKAGLPVTQQGIAEYWLRKQQSK